MARTISGNKIPFTPQTGKRAAPRIMAPTFSAAVDSKMSAPRPAQSPTLSPTRSAMTAGLRGSSFGVAAQVSADIGGLGVDAAAKLGEERNQGCAKAEADQLIGRSLRIRQAAE